VLKAEDFGTWTEIDIKATGKKKLEVNFYDYKIPGACNPTFACIKLYWRRIKLRPCGLIR
jgi:uncharacterized protein (DUF302 family)